MNDFLAAFDFIDACVSQEDVPDLVTQFQGLIGKFGMTSFAVGEPGSPYKFKPDRIWAGTWPEGWAKLWGEGQLVRSDPVIFQLLLQNTPFRWSDLRKHATGRGAWVMDAATEFNLHDGFGIAIHSAGGARAAVTMGGQECALSIREEASLQLASIYFHARVEKLLGRRVLPSIPPLTIRESDCLSWVANGKTDWETSMILSLSEDTVKKYVQSAMAKLDCTNRTQAVARAIFLGLITP